MSGLAIIFVVMGSMGGNVYMCLLGAALALGQIILVSKTQ